MIDISSIIIPPWISCHTYNWGLDNSRTYISNEKSHYYCQLDGLASDMWKMLLEGESNENFSNWAEKNCLTLGDINDFICDLEKQGLIDFKNSCNKTNDYSKYSFEQIDNTEDKESAFIREMQNWFFENGYMFSLFFELTYRCNLKCVHCYNPKDMSSIEIDFERCKQIIDEAYGLGCFKMIFSGGEATLHSHFLEIIGYARSKHISVEVFTNGQVLANDENLYNSLLGLYPYRISISLYSTEKEKHEKITSVEGSFEKTYGLINRLRKDNVNVQIKNFLLNINCNDCIKVKDMAKEINATSIADLSLIPTIEGDKKTFEYMTNEEDLFKLYTNPQSPLYVGADYVQTDLSDLENKTPCLGGFTGLCVSPMLNITVCVSMPMSLGNLNEESLTSLWKGAMKKDENNKLYKWRKLSLADYSDCFKEEYCKFCQYCPGMGYLENGFLKKSNVLCIQAKVKMKAYNLAIEGKK